MATVLEQEEELTGNLKHNNAVHLWSKIKGKEDLTALWYRLNEEKAEWIICYRLNQDNDDKTYPKTSHVGFGFVKPKDGKPFRTRDSDVVPLSYLLDDAKTRSRDVLIECGINAFVTVYILTGKLVLNHADERALGLHSLRFSETVEEVFTKRTVQVPL
ncbi:unnamed protein product [Arabidopsis arenosa]|uniref:Arginyl-tRNA synthetase catalytic core domain-containing protein n=1 Tax=Arabidopsis arenosa TaxID=38785 RepID=A0A8S2B3J4_ARAAE|nr:unnamed protein product [Arabidopsis arenosa]